MEIFWTSSANSDLLRLYEFLLLANERAAKKQIDSLVSTPDLLLKNPRIGEQLEKYKGREVRRIFVGKYELRYEISNSVIYILRIWHVKEDR